MDKVWGAELGQERGDNVGEENKAFGDGGADEVEGCGEDDNVEDIIDQACGMVSRGCMLVLSDIQSTVPNNQNAAHTRGSAPAKAALSRAQ